MCSFMHIALKDTNVSETSCFWEVGVRNFLRYSLLHFCTMCLLLIKCTNSTVTHNTRRVKYVLQ